MGLSRRRSVGGLRLRGATDDGPPPLLPSTRRGPHDWRPGHSDRARKGLRPQVGGNCVKDTKEEESCRTYGTARGNIPGGWRKSEIVPIYKKGDAMECGSYREVELMEHAMKFPQRLVDKRIILIGDVHTGFVEGKGTTDAVLMDCHADPQENTLERNNNIHCSFVNLEKTFDRVPTTQWS